MERGAEERPGPADCQVKRIGGSVQAQVVEVIKEVGSGLNGQRRAMIRVLRNPSITTVVVEQRDRLMRFGLEYVEAALAAQGRKLVVIDAEEMKDDIVRDLHEVIVSRCARLYGKRSAKNRAKRAVEAATAERHE